MHVQKSLNLLSIGLQLLLISKYGEIYELKVCTVYMILEQRDSKKNYWTLASPSQEGITLWENDCSMTPSSPSFGLQTDWGLHPTWYSSSWKPLCIPDRTLRRSKNWKAALWNRCLNIQKSHGVKSFSNKFRYGHRHSRGPGCCTI